MAGIPLQHSIIYGPVKSRRLGYSLGINLLPVSRKICSFNCVYCQYGEDNPADLKKRVDQLFPSETEVEEALISALERVETLDRITFSGNGEPTLHPHFSRIAEKVAKIRDQFKPNIPLVLFTNGSRLSVEEIRAGLQWIDEPYLKLDAGREEWFFRINRPAIGIRYSSVLEKAQGIPHLLIQTLLFEGVLSNHKPHQLEEYFQRILELKPCWVHLTTIDRPVAVEGLLPLSREKLQAIADLGQRRTGVPFFAFA